MCLKQELATTAEFVSEVLKRKRLKRETAQHAKAVREKRKDFASLRCKFPSLLNAGRTKSCFTTRRGWSRKPNKPSNLALGASSSSHTTWANLYLQNCTMTLLYGQRSVRWPPFIGRWPGSKSAIIGKTELRMRINPSRMLMRSAISSGTTITEEFLRDYVASDSCRNSPHHN